MSRELLTDRKEGCPMAIHESIEIGRSLHEVFDYACDANRLPEWQTHLVDVKTETQGPVRAVECGKRDAWVAARARSQSR
jgi:uncharacterized membrane protein